MIYNKQDFKKTNDKKMMRKVKKQWIIVSATMFSFLGIYGATNIANSNQTAHADVVNTYTPANSAATQSMGPSNDSSVVNTSYQTVTKNDPSSYASNASSAAIAVAQTSDNATKLTNNINSLYNNNRDKSNFISASAVASSATVKLTSVNADAQSQSTIASSNYQEVNNHLDAIKSLNTVDSAQVSSTKDIKNPSAVIDDAKQAQINGSLISDHATSISSLTTVISVAASNAENDQSVASQNYVELSNTDASLNGSSVAGQFASSSSAESSSSTSIESSASSSTQSNAIVSAESSVNSDVQSASSTESQSSSADSSTNSSAFNSFSDLFSGLDSSFTSMDSMNNDAEQNPYIPGANVFDSSNFENTVNNDVANASNINNSYSSFTFPTNADSVKYLV